ncbi:MAG TPA: hypothetical protein VE987_22575 [Polyangiaceae bacterium]|nr:hypothetical protein [Polyangiaceae bacterium]
MRELVPFALLAIASGAVVHDPMGCARGAPAARSAPAAASAASTPSSAPFETLVARRAAVAPGMREVARKESAGDKIEIAPASGRDTCVRVAFEADAPVVAKLVDGEGNVLASTDKAATDGVLGPAGPVCVRKGEAVSAVAEGAPASVRWVAWESP